MAAVKVEPTPVRTSWLGLKLIVVPTVVAVTEIVSVTHWLPLWQTETLSVPTANAFNARLLPEIVAEAMVGLELLEIK